MSYDWLACVCLSEFGGDKNHQHHMEHVIVCTNVSLTHTAPIEQT